MTINQRRMPATQRVATSILAPALACWAGSALAQSAPPDAGALLEQQRQSAAPNAPTTPPAAAPAAFTGFVSVTGLSPEEEALLRAVEARYKGQAVSPQRVLDLVMRELEQRGVTVVLQADAQSQVLAVRPRLSAIEVTDKRARPGADLRALLSYRLTVPGAMDRRQVERNATLLNETPGINASYQMAPGDQAGDTKLVATLDDGAAVDGYATLDNAGSPTIGRIQLTAGFGLNNPAGLGERLAFNGLVSEHGRYLQSSYDALLHPSGLRGSLSASAFRYAYSSATVPFDGSASVTGAQLLLPLDRSEWSRHNLSLALDHKRNAARINALSTSDWRVDALSLSLQGQRSLPSAGSAGYSVTAVFGDASQRNATALQNDEPFLKQSGPFAKLGLQGSLNWSLGASGLSMGLLGTGQMANKNLPGSEKLQIGGANLMRGRAPQLVGGDQAAHIEARLDQPVGTGWRVGAFVENAWLRANVNRVTAAAYQANTANEVTATDAGLRLSYAAAGAVVELTLARPLRGVPRFMNGSAIDPKGVPGADAPWSAHLRGTWRF